MGKNFFETIEEGMLEVNHNGEDVVLSLPEWLTEAKTVIENEKELIRWAQENEIIHGLLHNGMQKLLIDLRAAARPNDIAGEKKGEKVKVSIKEDVEGAQRRVNEFVVKPLQRPGQSKKDNGLETLMNTIRAMKMAGMANDGIKEILKATFDLGKITLAMNKLESEND